MAVLLGPAATSGVQAQYYYITDLGPGVSPTGINNEGTIVGSYTKPGETLGTAFRYSASAGLEDIGGPGSVATAVNDLGQVVGNTPDAAFLLDGRSARRWRGYKAWGINELGWISGGAVTENPWRKTPEPLAPAVYTGGEWEVMDIAGVYSRGTLQGVYADLYTLKDINRSGTAVGEKRRYGLTGSSAITVGYPYADVTSAADVDYLPPGGVAAAINDTGTVVGTGSNGRAFMCENACENTADIVDLGTLINTNGEYGLRSSALDVNENGEIVGDSWLAATNTSSYDPSQYHAVLWDNTGTINDLNTMTFIDDGWVLTSATAINDRGEIVGTGLLNGESRGVLLTSTAPTSVPPAPHEPPVALASADTVRGKAPLTVTFSSLGSSDADGLALTFEWDFGDGSVSSEPNPAHTYTEPGVYVATLVVVDDTGDPSKPAQIEIRVQQGGRK